MHSAAADHVHSSSSVHTSNSIDKLPFHDPFNLSSSPSTSRARRQTMSTQSQTQIWLDLFPDDISRQIAIYVSRQTPGLHVVPLAQVSCVQRLAVAKALSTPIPIPLSTLTKSTTALSPITASSYSGEYAARVANVFHDHELRVHSFEMTKWTADLLQKPSTTHCELGWDPELITALSGSTSLRVVDVEVGYHTNVIQLFRTLKQLDLHELHIRGSLGSETKIRRMVAEANDIVKCCVNITKICFKHFSFTEGVGEQVLWEALVQLPDCAEVCIVNEMSGPTYLAVPLSADEEEAAENAQIIPEHLARNSSRFKAVHAFALPVRLACLCTSLETFHAQADNRKRLLDEGDFSRLMQCRNLREIKLRVKVELIDSFVDMLQSLFHLKTLSIQWHRSRRCTSFEMASERVTERVVKAASPTLTDLRVKSAFCPFAEWERVLRFLGPRLKRLCIEDTFMGKVKLRDRYAVVQEDYIVNMLSAMLRFNTEIEQLQLLRPKRSSSRSVFGVEPLVDKYIRYLTERRPCLDEDMLITSLSEHHHI